MRLTKCIEWLQHYQSEGLYSYTVDYNEDSVENLVTWHITDSNAATLFALKFKQ